MSNNQSLVTLLEKNQEGVLIDWLNEQVTNPLYRKDLIDEAELKSESKKFLMLFADAVSSPDGGNTNAPSWKRAKEMLNDLSRSRGELGFSPSETATFVFSLKTPLYRMLRRENDLSGADVADGIAYCSELLDKLGLYTTEVYQKSRESVIIRQQENMLELSTPVVKLWTGILALPMIGTLDSGRTQIVMESLLENIVKEGADIAILDITGVPTVDTLVAQHLMKTVTAARLMGAECIISGIRPQIAQTIVHLGVDLSNVATKATLADAFALALQRRQLKIVKAQSAGSLSATNVHTS